MWCIFESQGSKKKLFNCVKLRIFSWAFFLISLLGEGELEAVSLGGLFRLVKIVESSKAFAIVLDPIRSILDL